MRHHLNGDNEYTYYKFLESEGVFETRSTEERVEALIADLIEEGDLTNLAEYLENYHLHLSYDEIESIVAEVLDSTDRN